MSMREIERNAGRVTLATLLCVFAFGFVAILFSLGSAPNVSAQFPPNTQRATTTVTVINLPPYFTVAAAENPASATTTPTNVGSAVTWEATAEDGNSEDYFLIICKNNTTPTPNPNAPPECSGGSVNRWARSATTTSGSQATASYVATSGNPEINNWWAFVCDFNAGDPACNSSFSGHTGAATGSPFVVNHQVSFTSFVDDSPTLPGGMVTWTTVATDADTLRGGDTFRLFVCRANDFTGTACGAGGTWATSTFVTSNPTATTTISIPTRDSNYAAYGFIVDEFNLVATGTAQGTNSVLTVANATPVILSSSVDVGSSSPLILTNPGGETTGLIVNLTVSDDNSCENISAGDEIDQVHLNMHRSGVATSSCVVAGDYNTNSCYPYAVGIAVWNVSCDRVPGSCTGPNSATEDWTCTFPLWFNADPTDAGSVFAAQNWVATLRAIDDNFATSSWTTGDTGTELQQFLAFQIAQATIAYGALEPGQNTGTLLGTSSLEALGNTGLDQEVFGTDMCITYPSCSGNATSTIFVNNQQFATTSGVLYGNGVNLSTSTSSPLQLYIPKPTATSTFNATTTYWGIEVPSAISVAGDYYGQNTIIGIVSPSGSW